MSDLRSRLSGRRARQLRQLAVRYVEHGWSVARLAVPRFGRCACGLVDCVDPHLIIARRSLITTKAEAEDAFDDDRWAIALPTHNFDVLEVPARYGAPLHQQLKTTCPTAQAPATRQWHFFVAAGSVPAAMIEAAGGRVISGSSGWVPAAGTITEATGRIRWLTPPYVANWQPYQRHDAIDAVFSTVDWSGDSAPATRLPRIVDEALS